jgi:hypothetical protein
MYFFSLLLCNETLHYLMNQSTLCHSCVFLSMHVRVKSHMISKSRLGEVEELGGGVERLL